MSIEIPRPCPFCGHAPQVIFTESRSGLVQCTYSSCPSRPMVYDGNDEKTRKGKSGDTIKSDAIYRWNYFQATPPDLPLQIQPTNKTCVHTCLSMATGIPVDFFIKRYGGDALYHRDLLRALTECKVQWNQFMEGTLIHQGWYFAGVPSLNYAGWSHQILLRWWGGKMTVLDPAQGRKYNEDGSNLRTWYELVAFHPGGERPR